jgi:hypothetical protein
VENRDNAQDAGMIGLRGQGPIRRRGRREKFSLNLFIFFAIDAMDFICRALCALRQANRSDATAPASAIITSCIANCRNHRREFAAGKM